MGLLGLDPGSAPSQLCPRPRHFLLQELHLLFLLNTFPRLITSTLLLLWGSPPLIFQASCISEAAQPSVWFGDRHVTQVGQALGLLMVGKDQPIPTGKMQIWCQQGWSLSPQGESIYTQNQHRKVEKGDGFLAVLFERLDTATPEAIPGIFGL